MNWMWGLLAVLIVLVLVGYLLARRRGDLAAAQGGDAAPERATGGAPGPAGPVDPAPEVAHASGPGRGTAVDDAARAEDAPGAWDDGDRPVAAPAGAPDGASPDGASPGGAVSDDAASSVATSPAGPLGAAPAGAVPEQAGPADPPARATEPTTGPATDPASDAGDQPGATGRHALRDDVEPAPLPEARVPEQAAAVDPLPTPSRSGGAAATGAAAGGSALAGLDSQLIGPASASGPAPQGARPGPFPGSVLAPVDGSDPPETHRVKVHSGSRRFHGPESPYYVRTRADLYFTGESAARAAGFMAWNERPGAV